MALNDSFVIKSKFILKVFNNILMYVAVNLYNIVVRPNTSLLDNKTNVHY